MILTQKRGGSLFFAFGNKNIVTGNGYHEAEYGKE